MTYAFLGFSTTKFYVQKEIEYSYVSSLGFLNEVRIGATLRNIHFSV